MIRQEAMITVRKIRPDEWQLGRAVRLAALRDSPEAFAETHAAVVAMPEEFWQGRAYRRP